MEDYNNIQDCSLVSIEWDHNKEGKTDRASLCSTRLSELSLHRSSISTIQDQCFESSSSNFQYNFKKTGSQWCNDRSSDKKTIESLSKTHLAEKYKKQGHQSLYANEINQLQDIEKKTQSLVIKEKQQRKQLKKLKKIYEETVNEYQQLKLKYQRQSQQISEKMESMKSQQDKFHEQKRSLQDKISQLRCTIKGIEQELKISQSNRQLLWRKLELIDANCQCRYQTPQKLKGQPQIPDRIEQVISYSDELASLRREVAIIDSKIQEKSKSPTYPQLQQIIRLYQLRQHFNSSIQQILVHQQSEKYERIIAKLNRIILNAYRKLYKSSAITEEPAISTSKRKVIQGSQHKDRCGDTADTFFTQKKAQSQYLQKTLTQTASLNYPGQQQDKWNSIKAQIQNVIGRNVISAYREIYQHMEDLAVGIIEMCELQCDQIQFVAFAQGIMQRLNSHLTDRAEKKYQKISRLMHAIQNKGTEERNTPELAGPGNDVQNAFI